jgi:hypothetical protein
MFVMSTLDPQRIRKITEKPLKFLVHSSSNFPIINNPRLFLSVQKYCAILRDFPIQGLLAAVDWDDMTRAIIDMFAHLKGIKRIEYPLARAIELVLGMCC